MSETRTGLRGAHRNTRIGQTGNLIMTTSNHHDPGEETIRLWIDLAADDALSPAQAERLTAALERHPAMRSEVRELERLHADLGTRVDVREGFRESVMRSLPAASWEPVGRQGWGLAVALAAILAVVSATLMTLVGTSPGGPGLGVLAAIGGLIKASVLTGAGLLGASWRGVGLALQQALDASPLTLVLFGVAVLTLNLLFLRLLRRRSSTSRVAVASSAESGSRKPGPSQE